MKINKKVAGIIKTAAITAAAVIVLAFPEVSSESAVNSINVCLNSIIPSMFAFMVITSYICSSGVYTVIFRPFLWLLRKIIKADDSILSVFILSMFGGYPIGVKLLRELTAQNKNFSAIRNVSADASMFCYCISPTFAFIMLGSGVFGSTAAGIVIYISDVLACIITGAVVSRSCSLRIPLTDKNSSGSIADAVNSSARALFTVCTIIIAFNTLLSCVGAALEQFGVQIPVIISGALEISNLLKIHAPESYMIPAAAAISSFGGICVLLQCAAIAGNIFSVKRFIIARIPCAALSALSAHIIMQFTDISVSASTISQNYTYTFSAERIIVLILIAMCIIIFHKSDKIFKKV